VISSPRSPTPESLPLRGSGTFLGNRARKVNGDSSISTASRLCARRGVSSAGRAPALQAGGRRFDPGTLHSSQPSRFSRNVEQIGNFSQRKAQDRSTHEDAVRDPDARVKRGSPGSGQGHKTASDVAIATTEAQLPHLRSPAVSVDSMRSTISFTIRCVRIKTMYLDAGTDSQSRFVGPRTQIDDPKGRSSVESR
jgi:hypothetical protein